MNSLNIRMGRIFLTTILSSLVLVACGIGSPDSATAPPADNTVPAPTPVPTPIPTTPANANQMGINIAAPLDWEEDRLYADVILFHEEFLLA